MIATQMTLSIQDFWLFVGMAFAFGWLSGAIGALAYSIRKAERP